jgi:hypothetical protein
MHLHVRALVRVSICVHVCEFLFVCVRDWIRARAMDDSRHSGRPSLLPSSNALCLPAFPVGPFITVSIQPLDSFFSSSL